MTLAESGNADAHQGRERRAGETVERLASRMATPDRAVNAFRILSGLAPNDRINSGEWMKIVVG
jgi:predicted Zn-dependent protease